MSVHVILLVIAARRVTLWLFARGGAVGIVRLTESGAPIFLPLERVRTHRNRDLSGTYRWYNDYRLPSGEGGGTVTVRLHGSDEDRERRLNRPENVRVIPPTDPDFAMLYARRNDAESINRALDDSLYLGRAHSKGQLRQQAEMLGYALLVNSLALDRRRRRRREAPAEELGYTVCR